MILSEGWVYVLSNKSFKGQVKIGYSTVSSHNRAKELDTTGVPTPFKLEYEIKVKNCELLEKKVHEHLRNKRVRKGREFFRIDIPTAISLVKEIGEEQKFDEVTYYRSPADIQKARILRETEIINKQNAKELKKDIACKVALTHEKLSRRIDELNKEIKKVKSRIAIFPGAKKDKELKLSDLELRANNNLALLNRLLLKNYFWEKYVNDTTIERYFPKSIQQFEALLNSGEPLGAIIVNDLFPIGVKLQISYSRITFMAGTKFSSEYDYIGACMKYAFFVQNSKRYSGAFNDPEMLQFYRETPKFDIKNCWNENFWKH